jgi:hypothetical protein
MRILWVVLTVMVLTPAADAGATIAWQEVPDQGQRAPVYAMADDGSGVHRIAPQASSFELAPDGSKIAYDAKDLIWVRGTAVGAPRAVSVRKGLGINAVAWAPDGRSLVTGVGRTVRVVGLTGRVRSSFKIGGRGAITGVAFAPDGAHVAVALDYYGYSGRARLVTATLRGRDRRQVSLPGVSGLRPLWGRDALAMVSGTIRGDFAQTTVWSGEPGDDLGDTKLKTYVIGPRMTGPAVEAAVPKDSWPIRFLADGRLLLAAAPGRQGCVYDVAARTCGPESASGLQDLGPDGATRLVLRGEEAYARDLGVQAPGADVPTTIPLPDDAGTAKFAQWRAPAVVAP